MAIEISKEEFKNQFPILFNKEIKNNIISEVLDDSNTILEEIWKVIVYLSEIYVSAEENECVLSHSLRQKAIYLTIAIYLIKTVNNFILRRQTSQMSSAKEGEVSVSYQDIPVNNIYEWDFAEPAIQPFGMLLKKILDVVQPCPVVILDYPVPYYNAGGFSV